MLAGPVLARLDELLRSLTRGFELREATVSRPRGSILWHRYIAESLARGAWHHLPCRFPELDRDPTLRRAIRWALERVRGDLLRFGGMDQLALRLAEVALLLLDGLRDVPAERPQSTRTHQQLGQLTNPIVRNGLEALGWVVDERGLGGGKEMDGLSWQLALDQLWERYVEAEIRREVAVQGGEVRVGRLKETVFPISWSRRGAGSLTHLVPDIVVRRGRGVHIIDAKYKAHFAEMDVQGWRNLGDEMRDSHRADLHQVLAYASLFDAEEITATLLYPLRWQTWSELEPDKRHVAVANLVHGGRSIRLELRGLPFGRLRAA